MAETAFPSFSCVDCGSPSIRIEGPLSDLAPVRCDGCGKDLGPLDIFLDDLHAVLHQQDVQHTAYNRQLRLVQKPH